MWKPDKTKNITRMTRREFYELPARNWSDDIGLFDSLVILPAIGGDESLDCFVYMVSQRMSGERPNHIHDSGYRNMDFVAVEGDHPICRLSGCSDVIHIDGIGGYGQDLYRRNPPKLPSTKPVVAWIMDCLPQSGLLRLFIGHSHKIKVDPATSSFSVYSVPIKKEEVNNG